MKQTYIYGIILIIILSICATLVLIDDISKAKLLKELKARAASEYYQDSYDSDDIIIDNMKIESLL